jgi:hypothetical protein
MAELATLSDSGEPQKEGTRIVGHSEQGTVQKYGGEVIPADGGIAIANARWGDRSMGGNS